MIIEFLKSLFRRDPDNYGVPKMPNPPPPPSLKSDEAFSCPFAKAAPLREYIVNSETNPFTIPLHDGAYKFPEVKEGEIASYVCAVNGGQEGFDYHKEKFLLKVLRNLCGKKPTIKDFMKFRVYAACGREIIIYNEVEAGELTYKLISESPLKCEFLFTPYYE